MNDRAPDLRPLSKMGELMHSATPAGGLQEHLEGRARLIAAVDKMRRTSRARPVLGAMAIAASIAAAVLFLPRVLGLKAPVAWRVENGVMGERGYVSVAPGAPAARLVFDDGSDVALEPASRARVARTTSMGAQLTLEQGRARVHVQHRDRTQWVIDAGPFAVHVTGTDFIIAWSAEADTLDVWMHSGRIEISGPLPGDALALTAGKHLRARPRDQTFQIDGEGEASWAPPSHEPVIVPPDSPSASTSAEPGSALGSLPSRTSALAAGWPQLVAAGDFARVVREAQALDLGRAIATRPLRDLRALGDAARYAGEIPLAERAYAAIRTRFPSSPEASTAAFLLGRVEEEQEHADAKALRWYDAYLTEAPRGGFAGDALGRKMVLTAKSQGRDSARAMAGRYLTEFPGGPYTAAARDLLP